MLFAKLFQKAMPAFSFLALLIAIALASIALSC
jgi:hypothetical protein